MKSLYYVGMDVHKDSIRIAVLKDMEKETVYEATVENDISKNCQNSLWFQAKRYGYFWVRGSERSSSLSR